MGLRWKIWQSPEDQPPWARPLLLAIAALAGLAYAWGMANASVETFYGAAARSMSESWHDFIFGAFDPAGTITVDKLPGALWVQALSLRIFGFHIWALILPQAVEGMLTVLVLYRAVRRLAGPSAGLVAALVLAATPVTVLLGRGNVSDSLLVLLLVLAADATSAALLNGRLRSLLLAGVWVGLAFQTKMVQAWLVLPALAAAYLLAAPAGRWRTRVWHVAAAGAVTCLVSLSWMTAVSLVPAHDRPYVDGSRDNSVFSQVFDYNAVARLGGLHAIGAAAGTPASFIPVLIRNQDTFNFVSQSIRPSWHRLLSGQFGLDGGWLLPAAVAAVLLVLLSRRGRGRTDPYRASVILWGGWWVTLAVFFSAGTYLNSYYIAALVPAVAALCGVGAALCGPPPWPAGVRLGMVATGAVCLVYGLYLLHSAPVVPGWIAPAALVVFVIAALLLLFEGRRLALPLACAALLPCVPVLFLPAAASATVVARGLGPFDSPFESYRISAVTQTGPAAGQHILRSVQQLESSGPPAPILFATDTSGSAAPFILYSGREVLPIGGYLGGAPVPTLAELQSDIRDGNVRLFLNVPIMPASTDPRILWIQAHCLLEGESPPGHPIRYGNYDCGVIQPGGPTAQPAPPEPVTGPASEAPASP
jgi:4-amino-4-deoxy-L-arabinose transferase-like glycosyltransferase